MIKIGFDARMIRHSGIGTYSRALLKHLTVKPEYDFTLFGDLNKLVNYQARKVLADFPIYSVKEQIFFPVLLKRNPVEIFHVPHYNAPLGYRGTLVVTVHDLIHLKFPPSRLAYVYARGMLEAVCRKARKIIAVSQHTKKDIIDMIGIPEQKITVIYNAVSDEIFAPATPSASLPNLETPYLLYVGNIKPAKNVTRLIDAFLLAKQKAPDLRLMLVGKNFMPQFTKEFCTQNQIEMAGEVTFSTLGEIYRRAKIFVFPSLYEGFGLPPLEAMACETPVICSNAASLPEVVGEAALLFDPENVQQLAALIAELWNDEPQRKKLIAKGLDQVKKFSWERCVEQTETVYREALG